MPSQKLKKGAYEIFKSSLYKKSRARRPHEHIKLINVCHSIKAEACSLCTRKCKVYFYHKCMDR
jgi:hypothetical protein